MSNPEPFRPLVVRNGGKPRSSLWDFLGDTFGRPKRGEVVWVIIFAVIAFLLAHNAG